MYLENVCNNKTSLRTALQNDIRHNRFVLQLRAVTAKVVLPKQVRRTTFGRQNWSGRTNLSAKSGPALPKTVRYSITE